MDYALIGTIARLTNTRPNWDREVTRAVGAARIWAIASGGNWTLVAPIVECPAAFSSKWKNYPMAVQEAKRAETNKVVFGSHSNAVSIHVASEGLATE